jgi:hypothetical protein
MQDVPSRDQSGQAAPWEAAVHRDPVDAEAGLSHFNMPMLVRLSPKRCFSWTLAH